MAGLSRFEKTVLGATAAFVLVTGSWFVFQRTASAPYEVITARQLPAQSQPVQEAPEELPEAPERPDSLLEGEVINVNTADIYDLQRLPKIGEKRAQAILAYREEHGPFQSVEELLQVSGIGEGILAGLTDYVTVDGEGPFPVE
ncbi:MAG: ComEA family DNA-binding protein [Lawsonibacter sp.]|nr:ComEA family DNA-binding protein [Lawsonibacter sp.]